MPSAPNSRAFAASSGVSAFARTPQPAGRVGPFEHGLEVVVHAWGDERRASRMTRPVPPSIVMEVAFLEAVPPLTRRALVHREVVAAR